MTNFLAIVGKFIATVLLGAATIFSPTIINQPKEFGGSFTPVQTQKTVLAGAGIGLTDTSVVLQSLKTPDGTYLQMSNFGDIGYGTIEPGTSKEEQISFTGITQNGNLTATLTGVSRGLTFVSPYTASSTLAKAHAGGSIFVISNTAAFYSQFAIQKTPATITGLWTFATSAIPILSTGTSTVFSLSTQFVTKGYADSLTFAGAPNGNFTTKGIYQEATTSELIVGTQIGSTAADLIVPNSYFGVTSAAKNMVPVTGVNGKLSQGFLDFTQPWTFVGDLTSQTNLNSTGTTTISGTNTNFTGTNVSFTNIPFIPTSTPTSSNMVASKQYVLDTAASFVSAFISSSTLSFSGSPPSSTVAFVVPHTGRVQVFFNSSFTNGTQYDGCQADIAVPGQTFSSPRTVSPNTSSPMNMSFSFITGVFAPGTYTATTTISTIGGGTCSDNGTKMYFEFVGQ